MLGAPGCLRPQLGMKGDFREMGGRGTVPLGHSPKFDSSLSGPVAQWEPPGAAGTPAAFSTSVY